MATVLYFLSLPPEKVAYLAVQYRDGGGFYGLKQRKASPLSALKKGRQRQKKGRKARPASPEYLERAAQFYLSRYASSVSNFKSVLQRKVRRRGLPEGTSEDEAAAWIDDIAVRFVTVGLLDDVVYGRARVTSQRRKGRSKRAIEADLRRKGVSPDLIEELLIEADDDGVDPEKVAAIAFARRRRLGPYATTEPEEPARELQRALAAFARAGFTYALARRVLELENIADADAMLREGDE